ncbi:reverse transcriptase domain-containing protein [Tanacetum coccineum]
MTTRVEKRNNNKFCEFYGEVGYNTDECMHLKRKIEESIKAGKLSHVIKELKQGSGKDQPKVKKKGETSGKDKAMAILMVQPWRNTHIMKQQDYSTRVHNGLRTRTIDFRRQTGCERKNQVAIHLEYPEQTIALGSTLTYEGHKALCELLRHNLDIFAWKPKDMTGVPRHLAKHRLNVREGCLPVRQKKRSQAPERNKALQKEVEKLVDADITKEVHYHSWLSNPLMVKNHDDNWRMCMDFKDLNKAFPKDGYPLPKIDWKNARATYQRLVDKTFQKQVGRNLEVYVDDLVIKIRTEHEIMRHIKEIFKTLREINMKLNPKKYTFGMEEGMFLGYKVNTKGIKTAEAEAAFKQMEKLIVELARLTAPMEKEELIMYLAAVREAMSTVIMTEREAKQMLVYFISRALQGRLQKWSIELGEYDIQYRPRTSVKRQILADFIVERLEDDSLVTTTEAEEDLPDPWILSIDGSSCIDGFGAGLILTNPEGTKFTYALSMHARTRSVVAKAIQTGYYWPTMHADARKMIRECQDCQSSNGDTPFSLTYETKIVILAEIGMPTLRTTKIDMEQNDEALEINLDLLEERKEQVAIREARSKAKMEKYYNSKVHNTSFKPGDLVYQNNDASHAKDS